MTIDTRLIARGTNEEFHHVMSPVTREPTLVVMSPAQAHGLFKAATLTTANTAIIVSPRPGLSLAVTDIIISGEKQAGSDVTVQFTDGADTEIMVIANQVDAPPSLGGNMQSYFYGWKDARVEMVTSGAGDATVTIGYIHTKKALTFAEWDALR